MEIATTYNGDGTICVAVRDYGSGIPEPTLERLFEQFFTTKEEGLGMGLAIVPSIVEAHGETLQPKTPMEAARVSVFVCRLRMGCHSCNGSSSPSKLRNCRGQHSTRPSRFHSL